MSESVITSLAILKVNWDKGQDYIDLFIPFVAECLRRSPTPEVSLKDIQQCIREQFGLQVPQAALATVLSRASKRGLVSRIHSVYRRNDAALGKVDIAPIKDEVARKYTALVERLVDYCAEQYTVRWSQEDAERALTAYLHERSVPILAALIEGTPIPPPDRRARSDTFLVNAFVEHLYQADPAGFEFLETVVKGSMLANVLVFPELGKVQGKFSRLAAYFDTPFLLRVLGCEGPEKEAASREVLDLLFEQGVDLKAFEHTVDEVLGVLDATARALRMPSGFRTAFGPVFEYSVAARRSASDIEALMANLKGRLAARHIRIESKPPMSIELSLDEQQLKNLLQQEVRYQSEDTLRHDLESLTAVYRLRHGRRPRDLESCGAIFVTTNEALAHASTRVLAPPERDVTVPLCVLDTTLATLAWLKRPTARPDLPRKMLVASCYAALQPPEDLWQLYLEEVRRLEESGEISAEEYIQLRFSTVARSELMKQTLGDARSLTSETVKEVLRASREAILAERQPEIEQERELRRKAEAELQQERAQRAAERQMQFERVHLLAVRAGGICSRIALAVAILIIGLILFIVNAGYLPNPWRIAANIVVAGLTVWSLVWGTSVKRVCRFVEARVTAKVEQYLWRLLGR
jgi:hypothetical protein